MSGQYARRPRRSIVSLLTLAVAVTFIAFPGAAVNAAPTSRPAEIIGVDPSDDGLLAVDVYSAAMRKIVKVQVSVPNRNATAHRPTLYLLGGLGEESPDHSVWTTHTDLRGFFKDKNVTVVLPIAGNGSLYTDWQRDDPVLGRYKWETFLTRELPPLIEKRFGGNGRRGIAGLSMGAGASLVLAARHPGFYASVAAYSGCYTTGGIVGQAYPRSIVTAFRGNPDNMWGSPADPDWARHDVLRLANNLRGTAVYVSSGTGRPGKYDAPGYPGNSNPVDRQVIGGGIEVGAYWCTRNLQDRLRQLRIPATVRIIDPGTHSWPYWIDQQRTSWPVIKRGLGM
ncbi:alpha/beta hydrolase [Gordonia bronchialis]|uniref:alpha/beta hydrolase n=1 Tax=Gordonia bronchialis TaxID=2054 RepID=UPI003984590C